MLQNPVDHGQLVKRHLLALQSDIDGQSGSVSTVELPALLFLKQLPVWFLNQSMKLRLFYPCAKVKHTF